MANSDPLTSCDLMGCFPLIDSGDSSLLHAQETGDGHRDFGSDSLPAAVQEQDQFSQ